MNDPKGLQIGEWHKAYPSGGITAVNVETLMLKARKLLGIVDQTAFPPWSILSKIPTGAQKEIIQLLQGLNAISTAE